LVGASKGKSRSSIRAPSAISIVAPRSVRSSAAVGTGAAGSGAGAAATPARAAARAATAGSKSRA
jgi:hypothetical protein